MLSKQALRRCFQKCLRTSIFGRGLCSITILRRKVLGVRDNFKLEFDVHFNELPMSYFIFILEHDEIMHQINKSNALFS